MKSTRRSIRYFFLNFSRLLRRMVRSTPIARSRADAKRQRALFHLSEELAETQEASEIFQRLTKGLHTNLGYTFVAVFISNPESGNRELEAAAGYAELQSPLHPGEGLSEASFLDGQVHYTPDVTQKENYFYGVGGSEVDVPLMVGGKVSGVLVAENRLPNAFDEVDIEVLTAAANIASLALEKVSLIEEQIRRTEQLEALQQTSREILAELDLQALLRSILDRAAKLLDAEGGELGLLEKGQIRIVVSYKIGGEKVGRMLTMGQGLMGRVAESGQPMLIPDYQSWSGRLPEYLDIHSTMCVPLKVGERVVGCFTTARFGQQRPFNEDDLNLLELFAQQAAVAVENARLYETAQREIERRRITQAEVTESKEYYKGLFINNPEAVVVADVEGNVTSWNPAAEKLFGYSFADVEGRNLDKFLAADETLYKEATRNTERLIEQGTVHATVQRTRKNGSFVDVELLSLPIYVNEKLTGFIAIYHDLTEIKRVERALRGQNQQMAREMELAGEIQRGFMRSNLPEIDGWDLSATLLSANETSGDFYSIRALPDGKVAILIADVVDKGVGAALTMALTWTLFRVTPLRVGAHPAKVFAEVNHRLINETKSDQFLTAFYGMLDTESGQFTYCNAGHNPPYLQTLKAGAAPQELIRTGMPLGVSEEEEWEVRSIQIADDQMLVMYTDGLTEGLNNKTEVFGEERLKRVLKGKGRNSASKVSAAILESFNDFVGDQAQSDDLALIVVKRK